MTLGDDDARRAVLVAALILVPTTGCLEPIGEATKDALTDGRPSSAERSLERPAEEGEIADTYEAAFDSLDPERSRASRVSFSLEIDPLDPATEGNVTFGVLVDEQEEIALTTVEGLQVLQNASESGPDTGFRSSLFSETDGLMFGQVGKTTVLGTPPAIVTRYNASAEWDSESEDLGNTGDGLGPGSIKEEMPDPQHVVRKFRNLSEEGNVSATTVEHQGQRALAIDVEHENETQAVDARLVVDPDTQRPLLLEGTFEDHENETFGGGAQMRAQFGFGEDADHERKSDVLRLASMTILNASADAEFASVNETKTYTVQPVRETGLVPLEEAQVQLRSSEEDAFGLSRLELTLPAEEGAVVTDDARLSYDDADADGHVSPGDTIGFQPRTTEAASWTLAMHDEKTGLHTVPLPGTLVLAIATIAAGLLVRRRGQN